MLAAVISIHAPAWGATQGRHHAHYILLISIHAPAWGATGLRVNLRHVAEISIHAPAWGATIAGLNCDMIIIFQSTLPRGERHLAYISFASPSTFQSTLPRGERRQEGALHMVCTSHFNPRSRVGSDANGSLAIPDVMLISIHAPAWGATIYVNTEDVEAIFQSTLPRGERPATFPEDTANGKFQSTLPRGERLRVRTPLFSARTFQSTLPRGERLQQIAINRYCCVISIHAPAWGATCKTQKRATSVLNFNPRSRVGSDNYQPRQQQRQQDFNPRSRVGSDWLWREHQTRVYHFNPRSRVGSDYWGDRMTKVELNISIHAPAWGATERTCASS